MLVDETDVGLWRRVLTGRRVRVATTCAPLTARQAAQVDRGMAGLAGFLDRAPERDEGGGSAGGN
ncbi:MAG: hypothetical protein ACLGIF_02415 [Actinomycetes bacterium]